MLCWAFAVVNSSYCIWMSRARTIHPTTIPKWEIDPNVRRSCPSWSEKSPKCIPTTYELTINWALLFLTLSTPTRKGSSKLYSVPSAFSLKRQLFYYKGFSAVSRGFRVNVLNVKGRIEFCQSSRLNNTTLKILLTKSNKSQMQIPLSVCLFRHASQVNSIIRTICIIRGW